MQIGIVMFFLFYVGNRKPESMGQEDNSVNIVTKV